jgi:hypothetical protein
MVDSFMFLHVILFISSKGIRFDAATQIANDEFLKILVQQSKELARARYKTEEKLFMNHPFLFF